MIGRAHPSGQALQAQAAPGCCSAVCSVDPKATDFFLPIYVPCLPWALPCTSYLHANPPFCPHSPPLCAPFSLHASLFAALIPPRSGFTLPMSTSPAQGAPLPSLSPGSSCGLTEPLLPLPTTASPSIQTGVGWHCPTWGRWLCRLQARLRNCVGQGFCSHSHTGAMRWEHTEAGHRDLEVLPTL